MTDAVARNPVAGVRLERNRGGVVVRALTRRSMVGTVVALVIPALLVGITQWRQKYPYLSALGEWATEHRAGEDVLQALEEFRRQPQPRALILIKGGRGDYVTQGKTWLLRGTEGRLRQHQWEHRAVSFTFDLDRRGPGEASVDWTLSFELPRGHELEAGAYIAGRSPSSGTLPRIAISGCGRGSGDTFGRFSILAIERGPDERLLKFAATFEQRTREIEPPTEGFILFEAGPPPSPHPTRLRWPARGAR